MRIRPSPPSAVRPGVSIRAVAGSFLTRGRYSTDASIYQIEPIGVVVPKHKRTIVQRNRLKRRLRELGRTVLLPALGNRGAVLDVLLRARPEAYTAPFAALRDDVAALTEELCSRAR